MQPTVQPKSADQPPRTGEGPGDLQYRFAEAGSRTLGRVQELIISSPFASFSESKCFPVSTRTVSTRYCTQGVCEDCSGRGPRSLGTFST